MTESPGHRWESNEYLSRKTVQHGQATQWEVWCQIREKLRFVADQNRVPAIDWRWSPFPFSYCGIPLVGSNLIFPFSCWPVFLALSFPVDCAEAFSMFDHSYLNICVSQFLRFHALFLSTSPSIFGHVYSRGYVSMPILFPRIGDRYIIPIFAPASLPAFFCISCRKIPTMRPFWMCSR